MSEVAVLLGILGALLIGAISPGPSFVLVSRIAVTTSRRNGVAAALGMGLGGIIFGGLALVGLSALLLEVAWLYAVLKLVGGVYLVYLAIRIWRGASEPTNVAEITKTKLKESTFSSFALGLFTQLSNPKTAIVYSSIFAAFLPASSPTWLLFTLPPLIFLVEASWYTVVALVFSANAPRSVYLASKRWIDRTAGAVMGALGLKLIVESLRSRYA
jgi:RhtB (resistance to homoserine/threonine) family protein